MTKRTAIECEGTEAAGQISSGAAEMIGDWFSDYPLGARLLLHRAPRTLWRLGLGTLVGRALTLLTTRGAKSGLCRRTVLMPHWLGDRLYVWCPYGNRGQWFQNLKAHPLVTVQSWKGAQGAQATTLQDDAEVAAVYQLLWKFDCRMLRAYLIAEGIDDSIPGVLAAKSRLHVVRLDPVVEPALPPQQADLVWVWPILAAAAAASVWFGVIRGGERRCSPR